MIDVFLRRGDQDTNTHVKMLRENVYLQDKGRGLRRNQPLLLASRTVTKQISVVQVTMTVVLCHGSSRKLTAKNSNQLIQYALLSSGSVPFFLINYFITKMLSFTHLSSWISIFIHSKGHCILALFPRLLSYIPSWRNNESLNELTVLHLPAKRCGR